jgi:hypothetical protein
MAALLDPPILAGIGAIATICGIVAGIGTVFYTAKAVRSGAEVGRMGQRLDCLMHCNERYDEIYKMKIRLIAETNEENSEREEKKISEFFSSYYSRFWGLQADQFDYWINGWIDNDTVFGWWLIIVQKFRIVNSIGSNQSLGTDYIDAGLKSNWTTTAHLEFGAANPWFRDFVDSMIIISNRDPSEEKARTDILEFMQRIESRINIFRSDNKNGISIRPYRHYRDIKIYKKVKWWEKIGFIRKMRYRLYY